MWRRVFVGGISFGGCLCFSVLCSLSLPLVCVFLGCLGFLEEASPVELSLFLLICLLFSPQHIMSFVILFVCWLSVGRLLLLRDRESVSSCKLVWRDLVFLWCTEGEGCPSVLVLKSGGPITFDSRLGVSSLDQVWFWAFYGFFRWIGGREVVEAAWSFRYELFGCGSTLVFRTESLILHGVFSLAMSSDERWCWISFLQW